MTIIEFNVWLAQHNMTQKELANKLGVSAQTITNWKINGHFPKWLSLSLRSIGRDQVQQLIDGSK